MSFSGEGIEHPYISKYMDHFLWLKTGNVTVTRISTEGNLPEVDCRFVAGIMLQDLVRHTVNEHLLDNFANSSLIDRN